MERFNHKRSDYYIATIIIILLMAGIFTFAALNFASLKGLTGYASKSGLESESNDLQQKEDLLLEEAKKQNIEVNDEHVENFVQKNLEAHQIKESELIQQVQQAGLTYDEFKERLKSQITISELINKNVDLSNIKVSDEEVDAYISTQMLEYKDVFDDQDVAVLKAKVRSFLLQQKQTEAVGEYIKTLK